MSGDAAVCGGFSHTLWQVPSMSQVGPLTKGRADGTPYTRPAEGERQIAAALTLPLEEIVARARPDATLRLRDETVALPEHVPVTRMYRDSLNRSRAMRLSRWGDGMVFATIDSDACLRDLRQQYLLFLREGYDGQNRCSGQVLMRRLTLRRARRSWHRRMVTWCRTWGQGYDLGGQNAQIL